MFGRAEAIESFGYRRMILKFHPLLVHPQNLLRESTNDADLADSLDGIRLEWNEPLTIAEDSENLAYN